MEILIQIIAVLVGIMLAALIWTLITLDIRKAPGGRILLYGPSVWFVGFIGAATFFTAGYLTWKDGGFSSPLTLGIFLVLILMCVTLILEAAFVRITYDDHYITTRSPWRSVRRIFWHSLVGCSWPELNRWPIPDTRTHGKIRLSSYPIGQQKFFPVLIERMGIH
jgi:hypothetical protein